MITGTVLLAFVIAFFVIGIVGSIAMKILSIAFGLVKFAIMVVLALLLTPVILLLL